MAEWRVRGRRWTRRSVTAAVGALCVGGLVIPAGGRPVLAMERLAAGQTVCFDGELPSGQVVPPGATVTATVTGIQPDDIGFISLHQADEPSDATSSVNINPGLNLANTTTYVAGSDGGICITSSVGVHATVDVIGYDESSDVVGVSERLFDSRSSGRLAPGDAVCFDGSLPGGGSIPAGSLVTATVTGIQPDAIGFLSLHRPDQAFDETSSVNVNPGLNLANTTWYVAGPDGGICLTSSVPAHATIDVVGYETAATTTASVVDERLVDTRDDGFRINEFFRISWKCDDGPLPSGTVMPEGAAVIATITGIRPDAIGYMNFSTPSEPYDLTSSVNVANGLNLANTTVFPLTDRGVCIFSSTPTHAAVDIVAFDPDTTIQFVQQRIFDSRRAELAVPVTAPTSPVFVSGDRSLIDRVTVDCTFGTIRRAGEDQVDPTTILRIIVDGLDFTAGDDVSDQVGYQIRMFGPPIASRGFAFHDKESVTISGRALGTHPYMRGAFTLEVDTDNDNEIEATASFEVPGLVCREP